MMTVRPTITISIEIDPAGIGDSTGKDRAWQKRVVAAVAKDLAAYVAKHHPDAGLSLSVKIGQPGRSTCECEGIDAETVREIEQAAFDRVCG